MRLKEKHPLQGFFMHGVPRNGVVSGEEYVTTCVFCSKEDKFYINTQKKVFDCKVCGSQGNFLQFLTKVSDLNQKNITEEHLAALALDRELPVEAFEGYGIGWDDRKFTFPVYDYDKKFVGLRCYQPGGKMWNTAGTPAALFNAQQLKEDTDATIFLCYADDTEVLTKKGWVLFSALTKNDFVAAYHRDNCGIQFEQPSALQIFPYTGEMVYIKTNFSGLLVTPEHRVFTKYERCIPKIISAFAVKRHHLLPTSGTYISSKHTPLTEANVRLLACFQADGCWEKRGFKAIWALKKKRKKIRLEKLLLKNKISFDKRHWRSAKGYNQYIVEKKKLSNIFNFDLKKFQWAFIDWPLNIRKAFLNELQYWDGDTTGKKCWRYFTSNKENAEIVSALASISGISVIQRTQHRTHRKNNSPEYILNFKETSWRAIGCTPSKKAYSGNVYCCTVSTGMIVTRRNGKVTIAGNCEGEWDTFAANWLLSTLKKEGVAVGVPGANVFSETWTEWFFKRKVVVLYDNDQAGEKGELRVQRELENVVSNINYLNWPDTRPDGYDLRDLIKLRAVKRNKPKSTFKYIQNHLENFPSKMLPATEAQIIELSGKPLEPITFREVVQIFQEFLYMPDVTPIRVLLATVLANRLRSDMVWMFLVAPPASAKSELIQSLYHCKEVMVVDQMSQNTLLSGWLSPDKKDPSLLGKMDGSIMAMKDFTSVLSLPIVAQQAIFGQLRFAYDGDSTARYGHHEGTRRHKAHFGIVAGVTPAIEKAGLTQAVLGERFLRYHLPKIDDDQTMKKSGSYMGQEQELRLNIRNAVMRFLGTHTADLPTIPEDIQSKIRNMSRLTALMRGIVDRDLDRHVAYTPVGESPNRINKQLLAIAIGLASLEKKKEVDVDDLSIVRDIAIGSCPERVQKIIALLERTDAPLRVKEMETRINYPFSTLKKVLEDLRMLNLVQVSGTGFNLYFTLTDRVREWINESGVYDSHRLTVDADKNLSSPKRHFNLGHKRVKRPATV